MLLRMLPTDRTCAADPTRFAESRSGETMLRDSIRKENPTWNRADPPGARLAAGPAAGPGDEPPGGAPPKKPVDPSRERDGAVATKERSKSARPPRFKVILYNDNYTPMEFVVQVLEKVFGKSPSAATQIMLQIHRSGMGIGGVYVLEVAETKSATVLRMAEERGYPLRSGVEKE